MDKSDIKSQIEKNEAEIKRLQNFNGALGVELFKEDLPFLFEKGDILIKENRRVRFIEYGYNIRPCGEIQNVFRVINFLQNDKDGIARDIDIDIGTEGWRHFIPETKD